MISFNSQNLNNHLKGNILKIFFLVLTVTLLIYPSIIFAKVPQIGKITIDSDDNSTSVIITMDQKVPVKLFETKKGAKIIDFKGLRFGKPGYKERPESLLVYSIRIRPGKAGLRVVLNQKHFLPEKAVTYEARYIGIKPHTYQIKLTNNLKKLISKAPNTTTVVIDPGHGGIDPGNLGKTVYEKVITSAISEKLNKLLNKTKGYRSFLTRTKDVYIPLEDRTRIAELYGADMMISIHANAYAGKQVVKGFEIFQLSSKGQKLIRKYLTASEKTLFKKTVVKNFQLSQSIRDEMFKQTGLRDRGVKPDELIVTRSFKFPSILVEAGFLTHKPEEKKLKNPAFQDKVAKSIRDGILLYEKRHKAKWTGPVRPRKPKKKKKNVQPVPKNGYKIVSGDTVGKIAKKYGVTAEAIAKKNNMKNMNKIFVGQILLIPPPPPPSLPPKPAKPAKPANPTKISKTDKNNQNNQGD